MKENLYEILGVNKNATEEEIKSAYKKLTLKHHPDKFHNKSQEEQKKAQENFTKITAAYKVLSDKEKRNRYDKYGSTEEYEQGFEGGFQGFEDIFNQFFKNSGFQGFDFSSGFGSYSSAHQTVKGSDLQYTLYITLEEIFKNKEYTINIPRKISCNQCSGTGIAANSSKKTCNTCNGKGKYKFSKQWFQIEQQCNACNGSGYTFDKCTKCHGNGSIYENSIIKTKLPKGISDNIQIVLPKQGNYPDYGEKRIQGDLYLIVRIKQHELFEIKGFDVYFNAQLDIFQAALGTELQVPLIEGNSTKIKIDAGTQNAQQYTLKNFGLFKNEYTRGNLYIVCNIEIPKFITQEELELANKLKAIYKKPTKSSSFWEKIKKYLG